MKEKAVISEGTIAFFEKEDPDVMAYRRQYEDQELVVLAHLTDGEKTVRADGGTAIRADEKAAVQADGAEMARADVDMAGGTEGGLSVGAEGAASVGGESRGSVKVIGGRSRYEKLLGNYGDWQGDGQEILLRPFEVLVLEKVGR